MFNDASGLHCHSILSPLRTGYNFFWLNLYEQIPKLYSSPPPPFPPFFFSSTQFECAIFSDMHQHFTPAAAVFMDIMVMLSVGWWLELIQPWLPLKRMLSFYVFSSLSKSKEPVKCWWVYTWKHWHWTWRSSSQIIALCVSVPRLSLGWSLIRDSAAPLTDKQNWL